MLCDLLSATGQAGRPQSFFRRQDIERRGTAWGLHPAEFPDRSSFDRAYLAAVLQEGAGQTGVFGLRLMWGIVGEVLERLRPLYPEASGSALFGAIFGPLVYVHVSRRDKLAQAISLLRAEQSGLWHVSADGSDRQRTAPTAPVGYDARRIGELLAELERDDSAWNDFFSRQAIEPVRIEYETLAASPRAEVGKILVALGAPPGAASGLVVRTSKMADAESSLWAERFRREQSSPAKA